ncbi:MAG: CoA transferase, partial [Deltaproteobacteria bacterium]|nr:CoA transferase [Deltaproteobacteria bacterium]
PAATNNSMTGWSHTAWEYAGAKGTKSLGIGDEAAGVSMTVGILAALHARERTGVGQRIVVSMQEAVLGFMVSSMHEHFTGHMVGNTPMEVADGYFTLRIPHMDDGGWSRLAERMGRPELAKDPRFAIAAARREHKDELDRLVRDWAKTRTRQELWDAVRDLGYFGAPVLTKAEVLDDPHIKERNAFIERDHPTAGPTTLLAPWIHMSQTPASIRDDAPAIGQHTEEVLGGLLGLTEAELADLRNTAVIR